MQATVEQISEVVNKLLSERLSMPSAPVKQVPQNGVQMPLFDLPPDDDWMKMPPRVFGQALADKLESSPVLKSQKKLDTDAAVILASIYGENLINILLSRKTNLKNRTFQELISLNDEDSRRRRLLFELLEIEP